LGCANSTALGVDPEIRDDPPHYDAHAVFRNLTFQEGLLSSELLNICGISANGFIDLAIQDSTGDLNSTEDGRPGFMVSDDPLMSTFPPGMLSHERRMCAILSRDMFPWNKLCDPRC